MKLVVLSDLHLVLPGEHLVGIDPYARLEAAIDRINRVHSDAALVVLAGDVTDRSRTAAYVDLRRALDQLKPSWAITLGNHDNRDVFTRVFGPEHLDENGFVQSAHPLGDQTVIVLDSLEKGLSGGGWGRGEGVLCRRRLDWLTDRLNETEGRPVHLVLHHPVLQVSPVPDPYLLMNPEKLLAIIDAYPDIRSVTAGHIHMTTTTLRRGVAYHTIAGGHATSREEFGHPPLRVRLDGPAQMAVLISDAEKTVVHFDNYVDANGPLSAS